MALWLPLFLASEEKKKASSERVKLCSEGRELPQIAALRGPREGRWQTGRPCDDKAARSAISPRLEAKQESNLDLEKSVEKQTFKWDFCADCTRQGNWKWNRETEERRKNNRSPEHIVEWK